MRMVVTAKTAKVYGQILSSGDEFECSEKEAKTWLALSKAKISERDVGKMVGALKSNGSDGPYTLMTPNETIEVSQGGRRGRYSRRDMRSES